MLRRQTIQNIKNIQKMWDLRDIFFLRFQETRFMAHTINPAFTSLMQTEPYFNWRKKWAGPTFEHEDIQKYIKSDKWRPLWRGSKGSEHDRWGGTISL